MKKQASRFLAIILTVLMLFSPLSVAVSALSIGETVKVSGAKEWITGFYYSFKNSGFGTNKYGQHQYLHTSNGRPAYCVEPNEHFTDGNKTIQKTFTSLSQDTQKKITAAFLYGFDGNTKYGYTWQTEYVATQGVIWALVQGYFNTAQEDAFLNCAFGGSTSSANRANCKAVYGNIKTQILSHYTVPSFATKRLDLATSEITLKYNSSSGKYEGSVTDGNGVLSGYSFYCSGVDFTKSGNTLYISTDRILDSVTVSGERTSNSYVTSLPAICAGYAVGSDQTTAVALDLKDPVNAYFSLKTESLGKIQINKSAEKGDAIGTMFNIKGNGIDMNVTIDTPVSNSRDGYVLISDLTPGTYTVTEIGIHEKYYVTPSTSQTVTVKPNETATVSFDNHIRRGNLEVYKNAEDGKNAGYKFVVSGTAICGDSIYETITTDESGKATLNNIPIGTYTVKEINCPSYMVRPSNHSITVEYNSTASVTFTNKFKRADIVLSKADADTGDTIIANDAVFEIYEYNSSNGTYDTLFGTMEYSNALDSSKYGTSVGYYATKLPITSVNEGKYRIIEVKAPTGYVTDTTVYDVVLTDDNSVVKVNDGTVVNKIQKAQIELTKTDRETGKAVKDAIYGVYAKNDIIANGVVMASANTKVDTLTTDENGKATSVELYLGEYYVKEETAPYGYALDDTAYDVTLSYDGEKSEVFTQISRVSDLPQKATIEVSKKDAETNKLIIASAKYGVYARDDIFVNGDLKYSKDQLVSTISTTNGKGKSIPLYLGTYYVKEVEAPEGYNSNTNIYYVPLMYQGQNVTVFNFDISDKDFSQKGKIKITKTDKETGKTIESLVTEFEVFARNKIIVNGETIYDAGQLVTALKTFEGVAETDYLPLGDYFVKEKTAPTGYVINNKEYDVSLAYDNTVESVSAEITISDMPQKAKITVSKVDKETVVPVENAVYVIKAKVDIKVNGDLKYRAGQVVAEVTTNANGQDVTEPLYLGSYTVTEKFAPKPYVRDKNIYSLNITYAGQSVEVQAIRCNVTNLAQKGTITVSKYGEVLNSVDENDGVYTPEYAVKSLKNAVYNIIANEDIYTADGTKRASEGEIVDTVTTGEDGTATSKELYLGSYKIVEKTAPYGMVNNAEPQYVTLSYAGQNETLTSANTSFINERQKATVEVEKLLEKDDLYNIGNADEITNVKFGLYADEDIVADNGTKIAKDGLLETANADENGHIEFISDIPMGKYYVKEVSTDKHYVPSGAKYPVEFIYAGQSVLAVRITANDGNAINNEIVRGTIEGIKVDEDGLMLAGALIGLFRSEETIFTEETALMTCESNLVGAFGFADVPYGDYIIHEIEAPQGFVLNDISYQVSISRNGETVEIEVENRFIVGSVQITKVDAEYPGNKLSGAEFEVYADVDGSKEFNPDIDILVNTMQETEPGIYKLGGLHYNGYFVHEKTAPEGFLIDDEYYYFEIKNDNETVVVSNNTDKTTFENISIKGKLEIIKTDIATGDFLSNVGFKVYDINGNVVDEGYTDQNGVVSFTLRYGKYTYQEFDAAPGYILDDTCYEVEIKSNGETVTANITNEAIPVEIPKTGNDYFNDTVTTIASLSAAWITLLFIKRRKTKSTL